MADIALKSAPANGSNSHTNSPATEVYAIFGAEPEVQVFAFVALDEGIAERDQHPKGGKIS